MNLYPGKVWKSKSIKDGSFQIVPVNAGDELENGPLPDKFRVYCAFMD